MARVTTQTLRHQFTRMTGRDPNETGRVATSLELFFDLTFVIGFAAASSQLAHLAAEGHWWSAIGGFVFATFAIVWAWINFTWFSSAFDTDDWFFRCTTGLQMLGVLILAMGIPAMFSSLDAGGVLDNRVMIGGYVVMRVAMIINWLRVAIQSVEYRRAATTYLIALVVAQGGWVVLFVLNLSVVVSVAGAIVCILIEFSGPVIAERAKATPWHGHHIAERYGLLFIITLGECLVGGVAAISAVVEEQGWSVDAAAVGLSGTVLAFGLWWTYYLLPAPQLLHAKRQAAFVFGYLHIIIFGAIAAIGAGMHVAALYVEHEAHISEALAIATTAVPLAIYLVSMAILSNGLVGLEPYQVVLTAVKLAMIVLAVVLAVAHVNIVVCLAVLALTPVVSIVYDELYGHQRRARQLNRLEASANPT